MFLGDMLTGSRKSYQRVPPLIRTFFPGSFVRSNTVHCIETKRQKWYKKMGYSHYDSVGYRMYYLSTLASSKIGRCQSCSTPTNYHHLGFETAVFTDQYFGDWCSGYSSRSKEGPQRYIFETLDMQHLEDGSLYKFSWFKSLDQYHQAALSGTPSTYFDSCCIPTQCCAMHSTILNPCMRP